MSEPEFEMYLSLMSKLLRLNGAQKSDIAEELRAHLEERLADLTAQGMSRDDAIRLALDEFGDAGALAWQFTRPHSLRRRRQIMRYTLGTFLSLCGIFLLVSLTWPVRPDLPPAVQRVAAEGESTLPTTETPAVEAGITNQEVKERQEIDAKLDSREFEFDFQSMDLAEVLPLLAERVSIPIIDVTVDDAGANQRISLRTPKGALSVRSALEIMLRQSGAPRLTYSIKDGVVLISNSNEDYEVQVHDCRDLLANAQWQGMTVGDNNAATGGMGMMGGGMGGGFFSVPAELLTDVVMAQFAGGGGNATPASTSPAGAALMNVILSATQPAPWMSIDGEGGSLSEFNGMLVVRHTQAVHRKIEDVLKKLRQTQQGKRDVSATKPEDAPPFVIPRGKRLVTLNGNGWQVPVNAIQPGRRVDVVRFRDNGESEVILENAEIVLPNIAPTFTGGFSAPSSLQVHSVSLIVSPEDAIALNQTELQTSVPLKFLLRGDNEADEEPVPERSEDQEEQAAEEDSDMEDEPAESDD